MSNVTLHDFLTRALGELPPKQRFVFECYHGLRGERELTFRETATLMGVNVTSVKRLYDRALARMQQLGGQQFLIGRGADSDPALVEDGVDESVCLSPFLPHHYGLPPGTRPEGLREEWMCSDSE